MLCVLNNTVFKCLLTNNYNNYVYILFKDRSYAKNAQVLSPVGRYDWLKSLVKSCVVFLSSFSDTDKLFKSNENTRCYVFIKKIILSWTCIYLKIVIVIYLQGRQLMQVLLNSWFEEIEGCSCQLCLKL